MLALLKQKGLATSLTAGVCRDLPEFATMRCSIGLTPEGLLKWPHIVGFVFEYISKLSRLSEEQWKGYFVERNAVRTMKFDFKGKEKSYAYARTLSRALSRNYPRKLFLRCFARPIAESGEVPWLVLLLKLSFVFYRAPVVACCAGPSTIEGK